MPDVFTQGWHEIVARPDGPLAIRFYVQPLVAAVLAVRDGLRDARRGNRAYFWSLFTDSADRRERLREGWRAIRKVFLIALILDVIYQLIVIQALRPLEALTIATALAIVPYVLLRGPVNRVARRVRGRPGGIVSNDPR
jgi:hypothetical protein